jgi:hypothetical protein
MDKRGLSNETIIKRGLGLDPRTGKFMVPIYDGEGKLINVRYYRPGGNPKWVNTPGFGSPNTLHPMDIILESDDLVWCEGEFDAYLTDQNGWPAFTATGGAKIVWQEEWYEIFKGKRIILCFDADNEGRNAIHRVMPHLKKCAESVQVATLPYKIVPKHGKDLTDWWLEGNTAPNFKRLIVSVKAQAPKHDFEEIEYEKLRKAGLENKPVAVKATISTINGPFLLMPHSITAECTMDWKANVCQFCPLGPKRKQGQGLYKVTPTADIHLNILYGNTRSRETEYKRHIGVPVKCPVVDITAESRAAWHGEARNGTNFSEDTLPILLFKDQPPRMGTAVELHGAIKSNPKRQTAVFVASNSRPVETELDRFQLTTEQANAIREYMGTLSSDPRRALEQIAESTEDHVTKRFGLRWLHICSDLVYHSILSFFFQDELVQRGWMELLAVGETRVGKSSALNALQNWYGYGEIIPCEKISVPGLIATSEKRSGGSGDNWVARVGKLPLLDRQLAIFDEAQGFKVEQIGQLSDARSSGIVKVTQAGSVETLARVRLIWLANPRVRGHVGINALMRVMGQLEDLARTDLPMFIRQGRMSESEVERWQNPDARTSTELDRAVMRSLMYWAWSRKPRDVRWHPGSAARVIKIADTMAEKYASDIPLMPEYEAQVRVARLAVAIAARLFSTDATGRHVRVLRKHVSAAGWVYANLFKHPDLEYLTEVSNRQENDDAEYKNGGELRKLIKDEPMLRVFLTEPSPSTRMVGQLLGTDSAYYLKQLGKLKAMKPDGPNWWVPDWARKIAQETR